MLGMVLGMREGSLLLDGNFDGSMLGIVVGKTEGNLLKVGFDE